MIKKIIQGIFVLVMVLPILGSAQDTHFSGVYNTRSYLNPALSSMYKGSAQGSMTYRRQWSSLGSDFPFQSYAFYVNKKIEWFDTNEFAFELRGQKNVAPGNSFFQNKILAGLNYKKMLTDGYNNAQFLAIGFSGGIGQNRASWDGLWFGNQFDRENGVPDFGRASGEDVSTLLDNKTYPDLNLGIMYELHMRTMSIVAGLTLSHLNKPDISFVPSLDIYNERKITALVSLNILAKEDLYFIFSPSYTNQGVFHDFNFKLGLTFAAPDIYDFSFGLAVSPRLVQNFEGLGLESASFQIFLEKKQYRFDFAYDATLSKLSDFNGGRGGFEFSMTYTLTNHDTKSSFVRHFHNL